MAMTDFDQLKDELDEQNGSDSGGYDSDLPEAADDAPILNISPQSAISFEEIVDIGLAGGIKDEQNIRVDSGFGNDLVVTLRNPTVADGELYAATNGAAADYKLVDTDNPSIEVDAKKEDGEWVENGILVYGHSFESDEVEDFGVAHSSEFHADGDDTFVKLFIGSSAGQRLAMTLDARGGESAYYSDGEKTMGLVEYPPRYNADDYNPSDDGYPRLARTPTLRDDMRGEEGVIFLYTDDEDGSGERNAMHRVTAFKGEADPSNTLEPPTGDDAVGEPEYNPFIVWDEPTDETDGGDEGNETSDDVAMPFDDDEETTIETVDDLPEEHQLFVDNAVDALDVDEKDVGAVYEQFCDDNDVPVLAEEVVIEAIEG